MTNLTRRGVVGFATTVSTGLATGVANPAARQRQRTYVLVHGAWHGGWVWRKVSRRLQQAGHIVFCPTLTGLGERAHLATPEVGLDTHIRDVCAVIEAEELSDVILVGHSYAGLVVTGVAAAMPDRVSRLVYLDAVVPIDGSCMFDIQQSGVRQAARAKAIDGWLMPSPQVADFGLDPADSETGGWVARRLTPQPIRTWEQPIILPRAPIQPKYFMHCIKPNLGGLFDRFASQAARTPGWRLSLLPTCHDAMVTRPDLVNAQLLAIA